MRGMSVPAAPRYQFKASPFLGAAASFGDVGAEEELETSPDEAVEQHEWAGDLFEEGTESDPADAYALFKGPGGEEAWLDRAEDGTLTAWVRDTDGSVYRYSDPEAWATDTDESGMGRVDPVAAVEEGGVEGEEPLEGEEDPADVEDDLSDEAGFAVEEDLDGELGEDEVDPDAAEAEVEADVAAVEGDLVDELAAEGADPDDIADAAVDVAEAVDEAVDEEDPDADEDGEDEDDWVSKLEGKGLASASSAHRWSVSFGDR